MENPYVFISYAHLDSEKVLPCVQAMREGGINLWYDEGIEAGSEWPEFIAEKVVNCTKFVLFISPAYLQSQNCKRELNFAISRKKDILSIFLEDVELSPGVEMQLGTYQAIYRKRFSSVEAFHSSLSKEAYFNICRRQEAPETVAQEAAPAAAEIPQQPTYEVPKSTFTAAPNTDTGEQTQAQKPVRIKKRKVAAALAILLGAFGVHKFYLGKIGWGILYLLFCQTGISAIVGVVEGVILLTTSEEDFEKKYNCPVGK